MISLAARLADIRFLRYLLASAGALAVDVGCFLALLSAGAWPAAASAAGYSLGIAAHWLISSRAVFADGLAQRGASRIRQKALFVGSALAGLALTTAIVGLGDFAGVDPRLAKLAAIAASFALTWVLRSRIVFRTRAGGDALGA
jgi:putative flippase GtrA